MEDILLLMGKEIVLANILRDNSTCNAEEQIPLARIAAWGAVSVDEVLFIQTMMEELCLQNLISDAARGRMTQSHVVGALEQLYPLYLQYYTNQLSEDDWAARVRVEGFDDAAQVSAILRECTENFVAGLRKYYGKIHMGRYPLDVIKEICGLSVPVNTEQMLKLLSMTGDA